MKFYVFNIIWYLLHTGNWRVHSRMRFSLFETICITWKKKVNVDQTKKTYFNYELFQHFLSIVSSFVYFKLGLILPDLFLFSKFRKSLRNSNSIFWISQNKKYPKTKNKLLIVTDWFGVHVFLYFTWENGKFIKLYRTTIAHQNIRKYNKLSSNI